MIIFIEDFNTVRVAIIENLVALGWEYIVELLVFLYKLDVRSASIFLLTKYYTL